MGIDARKVTVGIGAPKNMLFTVSPLQATRSIPIYGDPAQMGSGALRITAICGVPAPSDQTYGHFARCRRRSYGYASEFVQEVLGSQSTTPFPQTPHPSQAAANNSIKLIIIPRY